MVVPPVEMSEREQYILLEQDFYQGILLKINNAIRNKLREVLPEVSPYAIDKLVPLVMDRMRITKGISSDLSSTRYDVTFDIYKVMEDFIEKDDINWISDE